LLPPPGWQRNTGQQGSLEGNITMRCSKTHLWKV
jgi:hypothetical protein